MKKIFTIIFLIASVGGAHAQYPAVTIPGSEIRTITSAIVPGQEYDLQILLPSGYKESHKKYPVVFLMDAQWDFPLLKSIYGQQYFDGFIPEMIIVGITWGGRNPNADSLRARDYTPTNEKRLPQSGGADQFLRFMKQELFPYLDSSFRIDNDQRILMGCSLGGLFTMYSLFMHNDMFSGYIAASPAVGWGDNVLYKFAQSSNLKTSTRPLRVYVTVGDVEKDVPTFKKFDNFLKNQHYSNVIMRSKILENTGHSGTKSETYNRGLQFIFEKPDLVVSDAFLQAYTGKYADANGNTINVSTQKNQLVLQVPGEKELLKYAGDNLFYSNAAFLNMVFTKNRMAFQLNQFGKTTEYRKQ